MPRKKTKPEVELLPPSPTVSEAEFRRLLAEAIDRKVTEAMSGSLGAAFEPWFQPPEVMFEIKRRQSVIQQKKWAFYYSDHGCMICGTKDRPHQSLGMCEACHSRIRHRLAVSIRKRTPAAQFEDRGFMDTVRMAREALAPSVKVLSKDTKPHRLRSPRGLLAHEDSQ